LSGAAHFYLKYNGIYLPYCIFLLTLQRKRLKLSKKFKKPCGKLQIPSRKLKSIDGKFKKPDGKLRIPSRKLKNIDGKFKKLCGKL